MGFDIEKLVCKAEKEMCDVFVEFDEIAYKNTAKILDAFRENRVSEAHLGTSTGYGYGDIGRDTLDKIYTSVFGAKAGFVRHNIVNGTHALTIGLFALMRPGDILLSVTGSPYDTLCEVIGKDDDNKNGSLKDFGVEYREIQLKDGKIDFPAIKAAFDKDKSRIKAVFVQRSKGYLDRPTLKTSEINELCDFVRSISQAYIITDNCYGEFCETSEPKADLVIGSLIKNPGGGMAQSGGYIVGTDRAVELASYRLTSVGIGTEAGATLGQNRDLYKGLFFAPTVVAAAKKTAALAAYVFENMGYEVSPKWNESRSDIIQTLKLGKREALCRFCQGIQSASPVDSYVTPEPWAMPGYSDEVIMAAGTFISGASIELSADGPMRDPYIAFLQGGLTYESGKYAIIRAAKYVKGISKNSPSIAITNKI